MKTYEISYFKGVSQERVFHYMAENIEQVKSCVKFNEQETEARIIEFETIELPFGIGFTLEYSKHLWHRDDKKDVKCIITPPPGEGGQA